MAKTIFNTDSDFLGIITATQVANATGDVVTLDAFNVLKRRTYAEILTDINGFNLDQTVPQTIFGGVPNFSTGLDASSVQFDTAATPLADSPGLLQWNVDEDTLDLSANGVTYQIGQETSPLVRNATGVLIPNGTPVKFAGTLGASGRVLITPAIADGVIPSSYILGLTTEDIANGEDGHVTWFGKIRGLDTTGTPYGEVWADSDILYVSPTTAGHLTNIPPEAPAPQIFIGVVINAHASVGAIFTRPSWRGKLNDLEDVNGTPLITSGQLLVWDQPNQYFDFTSNISDFALSSHTHVIANITDFTDNSTNWNTAFGWGDHSIAGYLTSVAFADLTDYPVDAVGALTNDGIGNLSWAAASGGTWGSITGTLSAQTDLQSALDAKLNLTGGTLTGALIVQGGISGHWFRTTEVLDTNANNVFTTSGATNANSMVMGSNTTGSTNFPGALGQGVFFKGANEPRDFAFWRTNSDNNDGIYVGNKNGSAWVWNKILHEGNYGAVADNMAYKSNLNASEDLDTYLVTGLYNQNSNADAGTGTNYPHAVAGMLTVKDAESFIYQYYHTYQPNNDVWVRSKYLTNWSPWEKQWSSGNDGAGSGLDANFYQGYDISASGNRWGVMAEVRTDGVMNVGKYLDFHNTDATTGLDGRITLTGTNAWTFSSGEVIVDKITADTITSNSVTAADTTRLDGYGIMSNRATAMYITNAATGGSVRIGNNGIHNIDNIAIFDDTGLAVTGALGSTGDIRSTKTTARVEAYQDSARYGRLEGNTSGGALILSNAAGADTVLRGYAASDFTFEIKADGGVRAGTGGVNVTAGQVSMYGTDNRTKYNVWTGSTYGIGMGASYTYGGLNGFAMTFQMDATAARGWWWGRSSDSNAQGSMSLTNTGVLTVSSTMTASNFILSSDRRLKTNVETYKPNGIGFRTVSFDWINKEKGNNQIGYIAQEVEKNNPEFVITDKEGFKSVKYIDVLVAKMAEKDREIEDLTTRMERLELIIKDLL